MGTYAMTIRPGTYPDAIQDQTNKAACLDPGDTLEVKIAGFANTCRLNAIRFYVKKDDESAHLDFSAWVFSHGPKKIIHIHPKTGKSTPLFNVVWQSPTHVNVTNNAAVGSAEQHAWFRVEIFDTTMNPSTHKNDLWDLDPEVINTGGEDTRQGFQATTADDAIQTLGT